MCIRDQFDNETAGAILGWGRRSGQVSAVTYGGIEHGVVLVC